MSKRNALLALFLLVPVASLGLVPSMILESTRGTPLGQGVYFAAKAWILLLPLMWLLCVDKGKLSLSPAKQGGLGVGLILGIVIAVAIGAVYLFAGDQLVDPVSVREAAERNGIGTPARYLGLIVPLALVNALLEEYVWRWFVFKKCEVLVGGATAVILSALFFTIHHVVALKVQMDWPATLLASFGVFLGGCIWSWCYLKYRSIWPGYISHVCADIAIFAIGWQLIFVLD